MSKLFSPTTVGPYALSHRVVMAPLTRMRSDAGDMPNALMAQYYGQRASEGGLMVSEGTPVAVGGRGYARAGGIYNDDQIAGWRGVTDAVHAKGARIFAQLWHVGRQSHPDLQPDGRAPVAPSAVRAYGHAYTEAGAVDFAMPRVLDKKEIFEIVEAFRRSTERALEAGFDGVEIHGANGYLPDQFLQDGTNFRTDDYGGPIENRARFLLEVTDAAISVMGANRVAVRIAPSGSYGDMYDSTPEATFGHVADEMERRRIAYLHVIEPRIKGIELIQEGAEPVAAKHIRSRFSGTLIAAGGFTQETAETILTSGNADLVAFGRYFISNPDLPARFKRGVPLTPYERETFYGGGAEGYVDYPPNGGAAVA